jgi:hypothetical protein
MSKIGLECVHTSVFLDAVSSIVIMGKTFRLQMNSTRSQDKQSAYVPRGIGYIYSRARECLISHYETHSGLSLHWRY